ncbi:hypothetical protein RJ640_005214 [Escallonia rubra]|uniref:NIF system FeS cluster assembly NifU N-terminal domain-containing protein n=1 Tax=Escallonia rubra TaxID=112253 RepID=A0AA88U1U4_9ASTE|nr:hypothetical protein RJ640_005214 [Escallonia rubra]
MLRNGTRRLLGLGQLPAMAARGALPRMYHERVVDHYNNPRNVGSFDKDDATVGTGLVGAPACGDVMKLQIKVDDDGKIVDACFKTFGCGEIAKHLSLPPVKLHCSMLAEDAIKAAVKDYEAKRANGGVSPEAAPVEKAADA